jgi:type I restriction enzyme S subunit
LTDAGQFQLHRQKKDIARANLSLQDIGSLVVPAPPIAEQRQVVSEIGVLDRKTEAEEKRKAALQALFKTTLHHLMTGKIRVPKTVTSDK